MLLPLVGDCVTETSETNTEIVFGLLGSCANADAVTNNNDAAKVTDLFITTSLQRRRRLAVNGIRRRLLVGQSGGKTQKRKLNPTATFNEESPMTELLLPRVCFASKRRPRVGRN